MQRIGVSPTYLLGQDLSEPTQYARQLWFDALGRAAPHVLKTLRDEVYPIYLKHFGKSEADNSEEPTPHVKWDELVMLGDFEPGSTRELEEALRTWGVAFNIDAAWIYDEACLLLGCWHVNPEMRDRAGVSELKYVTFGGLPLTERDLQAELVQRISEPDLCWDTLRETPEAWGKRVSAEVAKVVAKARACVVDMPSKRNLEHFDWAVLNQVCEMNPEQIAYRYPNPTKEKEEMGKPPDRDDREVRKQIRSLLELIGLEPRKTKRGG